MFINVVLHITTIKRTTWNGFDAKSPARWKNAKGKSHGSLVDSGTIDGLMLRFSTAGESHGEGLLALLTGLPAGLRVDRDFIDHELWRRQQGYGRGGRQRIEQDHAHFLSGVRHGATIGSPVAIMLANRDWDNWREALPVEAGDPAKHRALAAPRPGHADLAGALKFNFPDARYVLERASARETTARVAAGAVTKLLLRALGIEVLSHVVAVGGARSPKPVTWKQIQELYAKPEVLLNCADPEAEQRFKGEVDRVLRTKDTVGGVFEVVAHHVPPGLGSMASWDERLDAKLAAALMSMQAVKAVEIGDGVANAARPGSEAHDEIGWRSQPLAVQEAPAGGELDAGYTNFTRSSNRAGGIEGGMSNGQDIVVRGYLKPISTLRSPLQSVDFATRQPVKAAYERSDVCVVPAGGVVGEAMVALVLAGCVLEKFGGDSMDELRRNVQGYAAQLQRF
jgi:chorismate synthase